jgi:hypothetical protein
MPAGEFLKLSRLDNDTTSTTRISIGQSRRVLGIIVRGEPRKCDGLCRCGGSERQHAAPVELRLHRSRVARERDECLDRCSGLLRHHGDAANNLAQTGFSASIAKFERLSRDCRNGHKSADQTLGGRHATECSIAFVAIGSLAMSLARSAWRPRAETSDVWRVTTKAVAWLSVVSKDPLPPGSPGTTARPRPPPVPRGPHLFTTGKSGASASPLVDSFRNCNHPKRREH